MAQPVRVLIADDSARAREGLRALLATWPEIEVVGEVANGEEAVGFVEESRPDVTLLDIQMPVMDGLKATRLIKSRWPEVRVVALSMFPLHRAAALAAGADVFVNKGDSPEQLLAALSAVNAGGER